MVQRYVRLKTVKSFDDWIEERRRNMEQLARALGNSKPLTKIDTMRIIAKDKAGIKLTPQLRAQLLRRGIRI